MAVRTRSPFIFSLLFLFFTFNLPLSLASDPISANQSLTGDQTLVSANGTFELGFYRPGNPSGYYICIVYKKVSLQTIAWVANRDKPISDKYSSVLKIIDGHLVLLNESQIPIWSTNQNSTTSNSVVAVLGDDGNFVLKDGFNSTQPIWQSFDFPSNTLLPGSKIGYNKRTNTHQYLTSWKKSEDPSDGLFSLSLDAINKQYVILWNSSVQYWTSGSWNGEIFSGVPEMRSNYIYNFTYVDNENESYFMYWVYDPSIMTRLIIDVSGQIKQMTWLENSGQWNVFWSQSREQCEVYAVCGAFQICNQNKKSFCACLNGFSRTAAGDRSLSHSGRCARDTELHCGNTSVANQESKDKFYVYSSVRLPVNSLSVNASSGASECESSCLNNCTCTAYSYDSHGCLIWIGELVNLRQFSSNDGSGRTLHLRLAASEFPTGNNKKGIIIGVAVGSVAVLLLGLVLTLIWKRQRRLVRKTKVVEGFLVAFGYKDLQIATKNFSKKLGGGGFGSVFKGTLPDSIAIAVKKLESVSQGEKQFRTEVSTIGAIQHVNLVRLRGFCSEGNHKLLVYDFMPKGSLDSHLFRKKVGQILDWKTRYEIALGTARGLTYLHEKCKDCIIHCDIKPENILLDAEFCPKVADFGLAKLIGRDFSRALTTMRGTIGYLAPEWISGVAITAKADVYSYGMMLFELVSGRRNSAESQDKKFKFFPIWAASVVAEGGDVFNLLDHRLENNADEEELRRIARVACWCIQDAENHRPTMGQVVQILEGVLEVNLPHVPRLLQAFTDSSSGQSSDLCLLSQRAGSETS